LDDRLSTSTVYDLNEYLLYSKYRSRYFLLIANVFLAISSFFMIILFAIHFGHNNGTLVLYICLYIFIIFSIVYFRSYPKIYYKKYNLEKDRIFYEFCDDHFKISYKYNEDYIKTYYSELNKISESSTHFYFSTTTFDLVIIVKTECSDDLIAFIRNLASSVSK